MSHFYSKTRRKQPKKVSNFRHAGSCVKMSPLVVCLCVCLFVRVVSGGWRGGGPDFGFKPVLISFLNISHHKTIRNDVKNSPTQKLIPPHKPGTPSTDTATQFLFLVVRRGGLVVSQVFSVAFGISRTR